MPAARIPEVALENGAALIHINLQPVEVSAPGEFSLVGRAGELLPALLQQAFPIS
jgi:NAD-dependent deacetylase